ncbi:hypothetical protein GlitD10_2288 [Gloeomargarita lithophora Alchichica-D10]|uniref:Uncharacterized protein n=2 Tax=Gloeomargarita TaxID=1188227 RepID=A0A1J0AFA2_9CYAN|nr:hypothetical protein GlitD10_2288 [Gloeomargarita lithophora Alchichica-D10]
MALVLGGCTVTVDQTASNAPTPSPVKPTPITPVATPAPSPSPGATPVATAPATQNGLIPSEDPNQRRDMLMPGRNDPFSAPGTSGTRPGEVVAIPPPPFDIAPPPGPLPQVQNAPLPPYDPGSSTLADFPGRGADIANMIMVHGVVQVGGQVQAIIKTPNEASARYVRSGQRLEGGLVLVKRIETRGLQPVVVFEQDGTQVARAVGQEPDFPVNPYTIGARVPSLQSQSPPAAPTVTAAPLPTQPTQPGATAPQRPAPRQSNMPSSPNQAVPAIVLPPAPPVR